MKKIYETPRMKVERAAEEDVIRCSAFNEEDNAVDVIFQEPDWGEIFG